MRPSNLLVVPFREVRHFMPEDSLHVEAIGVRAQQHHWRIPAHRHEGPVDGEALVAALLDDLLQAGRHRQHRLARPRPPVEGDDADRRVEEELEGEALLLGAGPQAPGLG